MATTTSVTSRRPTSTIQPLAPSAIKSTVSSISECDSDSQASARKRGRASSCCFSASSMMSAPP
ncbi:hypothetical protein HRK05_08900 [Bordetella pertussis]|uniref:hypothetical protein n=1 Tax=Bordetella pertussis TaxID=520 RepID=UPI0005DFF262|nr:hypothetical protein [Bordetella pertussis]ULY04780.1 hypothetical protein HRK00_10445 [Bordetella pertussis]ULY25563.1 hypothetical protein HRK06_08900 [Bordetella pertussis]ULY28882.1 hypothetical protein HRK05_08900 [Bordetella pertussis]ULY45984.1 hypothetical protein HRK01_09910 [Bordetella pertussis]ULY49275.1 hypothetical protein HRJ98_09545 [Bordetella pertussis]